MKTVVLFCALVAVSMALTEQQLEKMRQIRLPCLKAAGLTEEDHRKFRSDRNLLDNPKVKQHILCVYKKVGYITDSGDLDVDYFKKRLKTGLSDEKAEEIAEKCAVKKQTPEETAFSLLLCLRDNGPLDFSPVD